MEIFVNSLLYLLIHAPLKLMGTLLMVVCAPRIHIVLQGFVETIIFVKLLPNIAVETLT